jgi:3-methyl-2-oxobutanoate hydroxymethyltransferase
MPGTDLIERVLHKKRNGRKIIMLTAYDHLFARLIDGCGVDIILVGDSLANVALGLGSTRDVTLEEMLHHARAVRRAVSAALLVVDMPYESYQTDLYRALPNARRLIREAGCDAVKVEWFKGCLDVVKELRAGGVAVMGHIGLTPQTAGELGGFKVQGKSEPAAQQILEQARALDSAGCFALVLECVPEALAGRITSAVRMPTIGIGAGKFCDGQVLVSHDMLGLNQGRTPKFVKKYAQGADVFTAAIREFKVEVDRGDFPDADHTFH